ncbi:MAG: PilW family protein [Thermoanaerobaculia bacterium]
MRRKSQTRTQRGFTLTEILVAISIFSIVMIAALVMYDRNSRVFKSGIENADAQQNTRVAFDKLVSDLRMIGFDYDRDGIPSVAVATIWQPNLAYDVGDLVIPDPPNNFTYMCIQGGTSDSSQPTWPTTSGLQVVDNTVKWSTQTGTSQYQQPDEQIEYAGPAAIVLRGNFDYETASAEENGREADYQSAQFPVVTTANDEIVTYALVSKNTAANDDSITFYADMNVTGATASRTSYPGGNAERLITVTGVDTSNANPPYTLYRITFDDDANEVRTPMADNIRSMAFQYYQDVQGVNALQTLAGAADPTAATVLGAGQYDPDTPNALVAERVVRSRIKSVRLTLTGMTENADYEYQDTTDLASLTNYRKYRLESLIVPRNIGKRGLREQDITEPGAPILDEVGFGHCGLAFLKWTAPQVGGGVEQYAVLYDIDNVGGFAYTYSAGNTLEAYVPIPGDISQTWYFTVAAQNTYGTTPASNVPMSGIPFNRTKPEPVNTLAGTGDATSITLTMKMPTLNVSGKDTLWWEPSDQQLVDLNGLPVAEITDGSKARVRIFRGIAEDFVADPALNLAWGEASTGSNTPTADNANRTITWSDTGVAHCTDYWYRVQVLDRCAFNAALNASGDGTDGTSTIFPVSPAIAVGPFGTSQDNPDTPNPPSDLVIDSSSTCDDIANSCTVTIEWPKVVTDLANNPVTIDQYNVEFQRMVTTDGTNYVDDTAAGSNDIDQVTGLSITPGPSASYQKSGLAKVDPTGMLYQYRIRVRAQSCSAESADSAERRWPCTFTGGTMSVSATSVVDGDGTVNNAWSVYGSPDINVAGLTAATQLSLSFYKAGVPVISPMVITSPGASEVFSLPDLDDDGVPYQAVITASDAQGCSVSVIRYLVGSPTSCCLQPHNPPDTVAFQFSPGQTYVEVYLLNSCGSNLSLDGVKFKWTTSGLAGGTKLDGVQYPLASGSGFVTDPFNTTSSPITSTTPASAVPQIPAEAVVWTPSTTFVTGNVVKPSTLNGFSYVALNDGTTGAGQPTFPVTMGATIVDNDITWKAVPEVYTFRINFSKNLPRQPLLDVCINYTRGADAQTVCKIIDLNAVPTNNCD